MKIVIASDSYKGSFSAINVANAIEKGILEIFPKTLIKKFPVADGGEGTVETLMYSKNGKYIEVEVLNPLEEKIKARYGLLEDEIAIIEMASASGLTLLEENSLNPLLTSTYGTGELIKHAMENGANTIYVGLGGSGTNDGGVGMAQALGISFLDKHGKEIGRGGGELYKIDSIDLSKIHPLLEETRIIGISDVSNPLCGLNGASYIYGPQKGASPEDIEVLDRNLKHLGVKIMEELNIDVLDIKGSGAAGGLGAGLIAFCDAKLEPGIDMVLDILGIDRYIKEADLVITGEGKIDGQSIFGKVPIGVAKRAKKYKVPVIAIVGSMGEGAEKVFDHGIDYILDIVTEPMSLEYAMDNVEELIIKTASNAIRMFSSHI